MLYCIKKCFSDVGSSRGCQDPHVFLEAGVSSVDGGVLELVGDVSACRLHIMQAWREGGGELRMDNGQPYSKMGSLYVYFKMVEPEEQISCRPR